MESPSDDRERWKRIGELFASSVDRPAEERASFVERACGGDRELLREVSELLRQAERSTGPLASGVLGAPALGHAPEAPPPRSIGDFAILEELGRGGMGIVYLALQRSPRRQVALKCLRAILLEPRAVRRFEHEAEMLARLSHPGIAQIFEAGREGEGAEAFPYFAMELVRGSTLTEHAERARLSLPERLELFLEVCDAVQHAHQRGVIHRDLKPSNILVDESGRPKVLDFGIACAAGEAERLASLATDTRQLLGTLPYMSPEQLEGDPRAVDIRADVYALGVVLYELLSGRLPHDLEERPLPEAVRIACEREPVRLGSLDRRLRGDLETIAAKALERQRERRYASAAALADDVRHHLAHEPIAARPTTTVHQLLKFARRNRGLVAGVTAAFLFLLAGALGTTSGMLEAVEARDHAEERRRAAERAAREAREVKGFLEELLASVHPDVAAGSDTTLLRRMLDEAAARIEGRFPDEPLIEASLRMTLGRSYEQIGLYEEALGHLDRGLALLRELPPSDVERLDMLGNALAALGSTLMQLSRFEEAEPLFIECVLLDQKDPSAPADRITALSNLAQCLVQQLRYGEAEALYVRAITSMESDGGVPEDSSFLVFMGLGELHLRRGEYPEAESTLQCALEMASLDHPRAHTHRLQCLAPLGMLAWRRSDWDTAARYTQESLDISLALYGDAHPAVAQALSNQAMIHELRGDPESAERLLRRAIEISRSFEIEDQPSLAAKLRNLALVRQRRGDPGEAEILYRQALELEERWLAPGDPQRIYTLFNLARLLGESGRQEAEALLRKALAIAEAVPAQSPAPPDTIRAELERVVGTQSEVP